MSHARDECETEMSITTAVLTLCTRQPHEGESACDVWELGHGYSPLGTGADATRVASLREPTGQPDGVSLRRSFRGRRALQGGEQGPDLIRVVVSHTVDEEGWGAIHSAPNAAHEVLADPRSVNMLSQLVVEPLDVEPEHLSIDTKILVAQAHLVLIEEVMHLPEFALSSRSFSGLGGLFGLGVQDCDREVPEDKAKTLTH